MSSLKSAEKLALFAKSASIQPTMTLGKVQKRIPFQVPDGARTAPAVSEPTGGGLLGSQGFVDKLEGGAILLNRLHHDLECNSASSPSENASRRCLV